MARVKSTVSRDIFRAQFERECRPNFNCNDPYAYTQRVLLSPNHKLYIRRHSTAEGLRYALNPTGDVRWVTIPGKPFTLSLMSENKQLFNVELLNMMVDVNWLDNDKKLILTITNPHNLTYLHSKTNGLGIHFSPVHTHYQQLAPFKTSGENTNNLEILIVVILSILSLYEVNMIHYPRRARFALNRSMSFPVFVECVAAFVFFSVFSVYVKKPSLKLFHSVIKNCVAAVFTGLNILVIKDTIFQPEMDYMLLTMQQVTLLAALKISASNWDD